jgi:hypothetical protein
LERPKQRKTNMRFGSWNVRSLFRSGSPRTGARELLKHKLYLVRVQEIRWHKGGPEMADYMIINVSAKTGMPSSHRDRPFHT